MGLYEEKPCFGKTGDYRIQITCVLIRIYVDSHTFVERISEHLLVVVVVVNDLAFSIPSLSRL